MKFKKIIKRVGLRKLRRLNGVDILCVQIAICQERNLRTLGEVLGHISLKEVEGYWKEICNGDTEKKRYYQYGKQMIGKKPDLRVLKKNFLNHENKAYLEFLDKYK